MDEKILSIKNDVQKLTKAQNGVKKVEAFKKAYSNELSEEEDNKLDESLEIMNKYYENLRNKTIGAIQNNNSDEQFDVDMFSSEQ